MHPTRRSLLATVAPALGVMAGSLAIPSVATAAEPDLDEAGLHEGAEFIESIPDSALESQEAFDAWKSENPVITPRGPVSCGVDL